MLSFITSLSIFDCGTTHISHSFVINFVVSVDSAGAVDCLNGCRCLSKNLLQFIDLKISGYRHTQPGRAKIFGFFAVRDDLEPLRNYVFRHAIDNYEAVSVKPKTVI